MARKSRKSDELEAKTVDQVIDEMIAVAISRGFVNKSNQAHLFMGVAATLFSDDREAYDGAYASVRRGMYGKPAPEIGKAKRLSPPITTSTKPAKGKRGSKKTNSDLPDASKATFSACPLCGEKAPRRFVRQRDGHYWCHECRAKTTALPPEEIEKAKRACERSRRGEEE